MKMQRNSFKVGKGAEEKPKSDKRKEKKKEQKQKRDEEI